MKITICRAEVEARCYFTCQELWASRRRRSNTRSESVSSDFFTHRMWVRWLGTSVFHPGWKHHAVKKQPFYFSDEGWFFFFFRTSKRRLCRNDIATATSTATADKFIVCLITKSCLTNRMLILTRRICFSDEALAELSHLKYTVNRLRYALNFSSRRQNSVYPHFSGVGAAKTFRISAKNLLTHFCPHTSVLVWRVLI